MEKNPQNKALQYVTVSGMLLVNCCNQEKNPSGHTCIFIDQIKFQLLFVSMSPVDGHNLPYL